MDREILRKLGVTDGMIRHLESDDLQKPFGYRCRSPYYWRSSPIAERGIVPLWECGNTISYFNPTNSRFETCSLENIDDTWCSYSSIQGLFAELFVAGYEDEMDIEELREYADLFGFQHLESMLTEVKAAGEENSEWRKLFFSNCSRD
jgi:hypothetical protein